MLGHDVLPLACRQFPRVTVLEPRGASITLSCFCPTALAMLDEFDGAIEITTAATTNPITTAAITNPITTAAITNPITTAAITNPITNLHSSLFNSPDGLDARASLPPALRPDMLMDWESWWEFERLAVDACNREESLRAILARLGVAVERVRTWRPGHGELIDRVRTAFVDVEHLDAAGSTGDEAAPIAHRRFLACHAFASWTAHLGAGLRTWLRSLETIAFLLEQGWTVRETDLWLRHFADPRRLAAAWGSAEAHR